MTQDITTLIISTIGVLLFSAFFSGMEIAYVSSSKLRFEMEKAEHSLSSKALEVFYKHPNNFISTLLVGNNIALVVYGILMTQILGALFINDLHVNEGVELALNTVISTLIVLVTGEFLPKTIFKNTPNRLLTFFALPMLLIYVVLYPISQFTSLLSKCLLRLFGVRMKRSQGGNTFTKVDLDHLIQSSLNDSRDESEMNSEVRIFQNALDFSSVKVRDCMIPRTEVDSVSLDSSLDTLRNQFIESGHSKIIIYDEDIDDVKGYVHSSEMFHLQPHEDWTSHVREVPFIPETMPAQKLLKTFIQQKRSLAVVVDEFGGTSGIVTLEDLVEEIFGEIEDEHDTTSYTAVDLGNGEYKLSARMEIEQANEKFDLNLPESDQYLTIGGLILHKYQSFPKLNEVVKFDNFEFKILQKTASRIVLVQLKVKD